AIWAGQSRERGSGSAACVGCSGFRRRRHQRRGSAGCGLQADTDVWAIRCSRRWSASTSREEKRVNAETANLLFDVVERLEKSIVARDCPAVVMLDGERRLI